MNHCTIQSGSHTPWYLLQGSENFYPHKNLLAKKGTAWREQGWMVNFSKCTLFLDLTLEPYKAILNKNGKGNNPSKQSASEFTNLPKLGWTQWRNHTEKTCFKWFYFYFFFQVILNMQYLNMQYIPCRILKAKKPQNYKEVNFN